MDEEPEEIEEVETATIEKPRPKKVLSPKQLENLANGRNRLRAKVEETTEAKSQRKMEDRFDKLCSMLEKVQLPVPEVQQKLIAKRAAAKAIPEPVEEDDPIEEVVVEKPKAAVRKPAIAVVQPAKLMLSFR